MPIGIVSNDSFDAELASLTRQDKSTRTSTPLVTKLPNEHGRSRGDNNVPDSLRSIIGEDALLNGRSSALKLASDFGISASSVSAYSRGATSTTTYHEPKKSILDHINKSRERATKRASKTLNQALASITQEKLDYSDAKDLAGIAKDMSVIIKNLEPPQPIASGELNSVQFTIYAPQFKSEKTYEVITVQE